MCGSPCHIVTQEVLVKNRIDRQQLALPCQSDYTKNFQVETCVMLFDVAFDEN